MKSNFKQLQDSFTKNVFTIDSKALTFRINIDEINKEIRLKPFHATLLGLLFNNHPSPLTYEYIEKALKSHKISCPDVTRLHRKMSELRNILSKMHPSLKNIIENNRGIGYNLPLNWKEPSTSSNTNIVKIKNSKLVSELKLIQGLIEHSINLTSKAKIIKHDNRFILNRIPFHDDLTSLTESFNKSEVKILKELKSHFTDFHYIRIQFILAKLRTYISLCRISEFAITKDEWLDWHKNEVQIIFQELQNLILMHENKI
ncbi:MAG: winged helix-turn-helix domain-containing protein [Sphingobacteriia bacterium]|nr:winged helix-turn-helix domain-containing protein [Sphingobacteriia bacterium]